MSRRNFSGHHPNPLVDTAASIELAILQSELGMDISRVMDVEEDSTVYYAPSKLNFSRLSHSVLDNSISNLSHTRELVISPNVTVEAAQDTRLSNAFSPKISPMKKSDAQLEVSTNVARNVDQSNRSNLSELVKSDAPMSKMLPNTPVSGKNDSFSPNNNIRNAIIEQTDLDSTSQFHSFSENDNSCVEERNKSGCSSDLMSGSQHNSRRGDTGYSFSSSSLLKSLIPVTAGSDVGRLQSAISTLAISYRQLELESVHRSSEVSALKERVEILEKKNLDLSRELSHSEELNGYFQHCFEQLLNITAQNGPSSALLDLSNKFRSALVERSSGILADLNSRVASVLLSLPSLAQLRGSALSAAAQRLEASEEEILRLHQRIRSLEVAETAEFGGEGALVASLREEVERLRSSLVQQSAVHQARLSEAERARFAAERSQELAEAELRRLRNSADSAAAEVAALRAEGKCAAQAARRVQAELQDTKQRLEWAEQAVEVLKKEVTDRDVLIFDLNSEITGLVRDKNGPLLASPPVSAVSAEDSLKKDADVEVDSLGVSSAAVGRVIAGSPVAREQLALLQRLKVQETEIGIKIRSKEFQLRRLDDEIEYKRAFLAQQAAAATTTTSTTTTTTNNNNSNNLNTSIGNNDSIGSLKSLRSEGSAAPSTIDASLGSSLNETHFHTAILDDLDISQRERQSYKETQTEFLSPMNSSHNFGVEYTTPAPSTPVQGYEDRDLPFQTARKGVDSAGAKEELRKSAISAASRSLAKRASLSRTKREVNPYENQYMDEDPLLAGDNFPQLNQSVEAVRRHFNFSQSFSQDEELDLYTVSDAQHFVSESNSLFQGGTGENNGDRSVDASELSAIEFPQHRLSQTYGNQSVNTVSTQLDEHLGAQRNVNIPLPSSVEVSRLSERSEKRAQKQEPSSNSSNSSNSSDSLDIDSFTAPSLSAAMAMLRVPSQKSNVSLAFGEQFAEKLSLDQHSSKGYDSVGKARPRAPVTLSADELDRMDVPALGAVLESDEESLHRVNKVSEEKSKSSKKMPYSSMDLDGLEPLDERALEVEPDSMSFPSQRSLNHIKSIEMSPGANGTKASFEYSHLHFSSQAGPLPVSESILAPPLRGQAPPTGAKMPSFQSFSSIGIQNVNHPKDRGDDSSNEENDSDWSAEWDDTGALRRNGNKTPVEWVVATE